MKIKKFLLIPVNLWVFIHYVEILFSYILFADKGDFIYDVYTKFLITIKVYFLHSKNWLKQKKRFDLN